MKKEDIRKRFEREGYRLAYCNGSYFAKKHQQTYKVKFNLYICSMNLVIV